MVLIPSQNRYLFSSLASSPFLFCYKSSPQPVIISGPGPNPNREAMRVHPMPRKRNNITIRYARDPTRETVKKLRRLPHIFSRVLELPFRSDADVSVEEKPDCFKFVAETDGGGSMGGEVMAHMVEIHPGVTKIVVRTDGSSLGLSLLDELELDVWRFRLPDSTRPELVTAVYEDGELIVTVPKAAETEEEEKEEKETDGGGDRGFGGGMGNNRLVLVQ